MGAKAHTQSSTHKQSHTNTNTHIHSHVTGRHMEDDKTKHHKALESTAMEMVGVSCACFGNDHDHQHNGEKAQVEQGNNKGGASNKTTKWAVIECFCAYRPIMVLMQRCVVARVT